MEKESRLQNMQKMMLFLEDEREFTTGELSVRAGITVYMAFYWLKILHRNGMVERLSTGRGSPSRWKKTVAYSGEVDR